MSKETKEVNTEQHSQSDRNKPASEYTENGDKIQNGMFCYSREDRLNMVTYKKSAESLRLKEQPKRNAFIRPIKDLSQVPNRDAVKRNGFIYKNFE